MSDGLREYPLITNLDFRSGAESVRFTTLKLYLKSEGAEWSACHLILKTDLDTWKKAEQKDVFNNSIENRLITKEVKFNAEKPLLVEIALRPEKLGLLPSPADEMGEKVMAFLSTLPDNSPELMTENSWLALEVWQEHQLDPSIGGRIIKNGYRTVWSPPKNQIEKIKRLGPVSKTIVEAFIENNLPVRYNEATETFELKLAAGSQEYACFVKGDNQEIALSIGLVLEPEVPAGTEARVLDYLDEANRELAMGQFVLDNQQVWYRNTLQVSPELLNYTFVIETLLMSVTIMQHNAPDILNLMEIESPGSGS